MKRWLTLALAALALLGTARAEGYVCEAALPETPVPACGAYRRAPAVWDMDGLARKLWPEGGYGRRQSGDSLSFVFPANAEEGPGREMLWALAVDGLSYTWETEGERERLSADYDEALRQVRRFFGRWLPEALFADPAPNYGSFDEDGAPVSDVYSVEFLQPVEPGIPDAEARVWALWYAGTVDSAVVRAYTYAPVPEESPGAAYLSAGEALDCLRDAAARVDPGHTCTTFDDPRDRVVGVYPVFTSAFREDELLTLAWALDMQDAQKGFVTMVLVDATTGDVYDGHDGLLRRAG